MQRKTLPAKHFFAPAFLLIVVLIWGTADIGKSGAITPFSWGKLLGFNGWFEPVTFAGLEAQPKLQTVNEEILNDIHCLSDSKKCWIVGSNGIILFSDDDGETWKMRPNKLRHDLSGVYFSNSLEGWSVGKKGLIIHTLDGGKKWSVQPSGTNEDLSSIFFITKKIGWAIGFNGVILHTTDAGKSWGKQSSFTSHQLNAIQFNSVSEGWIVGNSGIVLHTEDSGKTWVKQEDITLGDLTAVFFKSQEQGWIVGELGGLFITKDGGHTWEDRSIFFADRLYDIQFISEHSGVISGKSGPGDNPWAVWQTQDGGDTWTRTNLKTLIPGKISVTSSNAIILLGGSIALRSSDSGKTWESTANYGDLRFSSIFSIKSTELWAAGTYGSIFHSPNRGQSWTPQKSNTINNIYDIFFTPSESGWAVGRNGTILHTQNKGATWEALSSGVKNDLTDTYFPSHNEGWVVGSGGIILHTQNAGKSWQKQISVTEEYLTSVYFISPEVGWVVGENGTILHTQNAGREWIDQHSGTPQGLVSVYFTSVKTGWAVGRGGVILYTQDAGKTWHSQSSGTQEYLSSIHFVTSKIGWVVGGSGTILSTIDAGKTWQIQTSAGKEYLTSVYFVTSEIGWITSWDGNVYQTFDGGKTWISSFTPNQNFYEKLRDKRFGNYYHWPSPFALLLLLISLLWLFITLRTASKNPSDYLPDERGGIADAPVQFLDEDKLGYAPLARGIYKLIRNVDSKPPLAIAVSAPWGQGKSSVMNMLHSLLKNDNAVVQFNAWHYRDDGQILAALIEHIRAQAVPNGISLANLGFRWNLLWRRLIAPYWRWWVVILPIGWLTAWQMGREFDLEWGAMYAHIEQQAHELINPLSALIGEKLASASPAIGVLLLLLASPLIVKKILAPLKSFTPAGEAPLYSAALNSLKATLQTTNRDWEADAGIRFQFQQDFSDICHALGRRKLVLLIDDLDRCDPKQIEQIINTLNFLFSNNMPCYVVMALDWDYVRTALGVAYKDMANALHHKIKVPKGESRAEIFAENYLRKIIQLKVELPDVDVVAAFAEQARLAPEETNAIPIGKLITKMGSDMLKILTSIKQALSANPAHGIGNAVARLRSLTKINLWDWTKSAGKFFCFLFKALMIEPIGVRLKRHGVNDTYRLGNLIVTVFFACLLGALIVATLIAITDNAKSNTIANAESADSPAVAAVNEPLPSPPEDAQAQSSKETANSPPMLVLDPQKNSADPVFHLFIIGLGFVGIFWTFWFMRQERDSAEFKQALAVWKLQLSHKIKAPREWRRLENNLRFFIMLARGYDYLPAHKRWELFVNRLKARLIAYAESTSYEPQKPFVFDEGIATRLIMADIFREGQVFEQLKVDFEGGSDPRGQLALDWLENGGYTIDEKLTEFFELFMNRGDEDVEDQVKRWLHLHSFKLQLPYKTER